MRAHKDIQQLVDSIPLVDTHEHLWEEKRRVDAVAKGKDSGLWASDFGILLGHYTDSDLIVTGAPPESLKKVTGYDLSPEEKWKLIAPYYEKARHTGYLRCLRESVRILYGEEDLRADNVARISGRIKEGVHPGFYKAILQEISHIEYCHVNSLETDVFMETAQPELLAQDMSTVALVCVNNREELAERSGVKLSNLGDWHQVIDWCFAQYGPRAIALKNQMAYQRRLDYAKVSKKDAEPLFLKRVTNEKSMTGEERKALEDHLFHYCLEKAQEYNLPVKLHTGYYAGHGGMPLERVRQNAGDLCPLLRAYPKVRFDLFHIGYPYHDEMIALAKNYPNAWLDMCWAWIINPAASVRFLKEFLMAVPANKVFTFGGDYMPVEMVPGHAAIARQGIAQALSELVDDGWLVDGEVPALADRLMRGNAHEVFDQAGKLAAWKKG